jgi:hypothetical protein
MEPNAPDNKERNCLINLKGCPVWVPFEKVQELDMIIAIITEDFWNEYFEEREN